MLWRVLKFPFNCLHPTLSSCNRMDVWNDDSEWNYQILLHLPNGFIPHISTGWPLYVGTTLVMGHTSLPAWLLCSTLVLYKNTFCDDRNVLSLHCPRWWPQVTSSIWACGMQLAWQRHWVSKFHLIAINSNLNSNDHMQIGQSWFRWLIHWCWFKQNGGKTIFIVCNRQNPSFAPMCALPVVHFFSLFGRATWHVGS